MVRYLNLTSLSKVRYLVGAFSMCVGDFAPMCANDPLPMCGRMVLPWWFLKKKDLANKPIKKKNNNELDLNGIHPNPLPLGLGLGMIGWVKAGLGFGCTRPRTNPPHAICFLSYVLFSRFLYNKCHSSRHSNDSGLYSLSR